MFHAVSWIMLFLLPFLIRTSGNEPNHKAPPAEHSFILFYILTNLFWVSFFYLNAYKLVPVFLFRRKIIWFVAAQLGALMVIMLIHFLLAYIFFDRSKFELSNFLVFNFFPYLFILAASTAYRLIIDKIENDQLQQARVNENLKTELSFLRSQVSPHFMFNVLNNMVALARKQSDQLEPSLIKLSSLMRYMLYETDEEKVYLEKEVEYLHSYIDLQQQRFGKKLVVHVSLEAFDDQYQIEPMLLIPFVENAFKHGTGMITDPQIDIELKAKNGILNFTVRNKFNDETEEVKDKTSGIGLTNVKRRLNLLYGPHHTLLIAKKDCWFTASLYLYAMFGSTMFTFRLVSNMKLLRLR